MSDTVLIVATSGRMLAVSARKAGIRPLVIDLFADRDTRDAAAACYRVRSLAYDDIVTCVQELTKRFGIREMIYGGGFETQPETLRELSAKLAVTGNDYQAFSRLLDRQAFFSLLSAQGIPFPEVRFSPPVDDRSWLVKPVAGYGGLGIRYWRPEAETLQAGETMYWQRYIDGRSLSVLFLADGQQAVPVGFHRQWTEADGFVLSGLVSLRFLPDILQTRISSWLEVLVPELGLKGLNSLDFIERDNTCQLLEINPRPSLSMQLHESVWEKGLLQAHRDACNGKLASPGDTIFRISGLQIVYARKRVEVSANAVWPDWCMDRPAGPCIIAAGQPVCSVVASGLEEKSVQDELCHRQQMIVNMIEGK